MRVRTPAALRPRRVARRGGMSWDEKVERGFPLAILLVALVGAVGWAVQGRWVETGTALVIALSLGWMAVS